MRTILFALVSGLIFGLGLALSGMANPEKVIGFLDITGRWDPSLVMVMVGGILVSLVGYRLAFRQQAPLCAARFDIPTKRGIDPQLIIGAGLFGVGWGLVGLCPGPAWTMLATQPREALLFITMMLVGLFVTDKYASPRREA
ncbi:DUF6691 family protein [Yunchengibacter salinarum]|uniref:DUF6691 family protein n=1 Tax=Yunchengibacter salinarum TaxID=3133399 RepID=UPI0035B631DD